MSEAMSIRNLKFPIHRQRLTGELGHQHRRKSSQIKTTAAVSYSTDSNIERSVLIGEEWLVTENKKYS